MADFFKFNGLPDLPEYTGEPINVLVVGFGAVGIICEIESKYLILHHYI